MRELNNTTDIDIFKAILTCASDFDEVTTLGTPRRTALLVKNLAETRTWDDGRGITLSMRSKEKAQDYRYMPEPDLVIFVPVKESI